MKEKEEIQKYRKRFGYFASLTILVTILHLLGFILFQSLATYDSVENIYQGSFSLMFCYSSTQFALTLGSLKNDFGFLKALGGVTSIVLGLLMVFLSTRAVKGKFLCHYIATGLYLLDTLFLIPEAILSFAGTYSLKYDAVSLCVSLCIHLLFLSLLVYSCYIARKIEKFEDNLPIYSSEEKKSL